ncbi:MAG: hypothetical protein HC834_10530 [Rhodospirillales bacterium]|nr:hypothetical protein [Rhodospirillales bacterium]
MHLDIFYDGGSGVSATTADLANVILWNNGDGTFRADPLAAGASGPGTGASPPDMVTSADYDVDGALDVMLTYFKSPDTTVQLYRNQGNGNHWVEIDLQGVTSNRDAIGAKVYVTAGGKTQLRAQNDSVHFEWGKTIGGCTSAWRETRKSTKYASSGRSDPTPSSATCRPTA